MEEINRCGGNSGACHGQMYNMGTPSLRQRLDGAEGKVPAASIATGELRLQSMGVTEPTTGTDTTKIKTMRREEGRPLCGQWPEGVDLAACSTATWMILLARTTPLAEVQEKELRGHVHASWSTCATADRQRA
jgi:acyl-CoA dehydrogenase